MQIKKQPQAFERDIDVIKRKIKPLLATGAVIFQDIEPNLGYHLQALGRVKFL